MITDSDTSIETVSIAALALGFVFVGSASDACVESILQALMMRSEIELSQPFARFLSVALGLLFLGKQDAAEPTLEVSIPMREEKAIQIEGRWLVDSAPQMTFWLQCSNTARIVFLDILTQRSRTAPILLAIFKLLIELLDEYDRNSQ